MLLFYMSLADTEQHCSVIEEIYHRYQGLMYHIALGILHDETLAEDAVHETMLCLIEWSRCHQMQEAEKMKGLIYLIVRQRALRLLGQQRRTISLEQLQGFEPVDFAGYESTEVGPMLSALGRLKAEYREILQLHYLLELSMKEIAQILDIKLSAAKQRLHRARQAIKREVRVCENE